MTGLPIPVQPIVDLAWVVGWGIASGVAALLIYRRFVGTQFA